MSTWRLDITYPGGTLTVHSTTLPERTHDPDGFDVTPAADPADRLASPPVIERWPEVLAYTITALPDPDTVRPPGRPPALSDEALYPVILTHAKKLARTARPLFTTGYSRTALVTLVRTDPRVVGGNDRIRALCGRALVEAREWWETEERPVWEAKREEQHLLRQLEAEAHPNDAALADAAQDAPDPDDDFDGWTIGTEVDHPTRGPGEVLAVYRNADGEVEIDLGLNDGTSMQRIAARPMRRFIADHT